MIRCCVSVDVDWPIVETRKYTSLDWTMWPVDVRKEEFAYFCLHSDSIGIWMTSREGCGLVACRLCKQGNYCLLASGAMTSNGSNSDSTKVRIPYQRIGYWMLYVMKVDESRETTWFIWFN